jgi:hypothetical protein
LYSFRVRISTSIFAAEEDHVIGAKESRGIYSTTQGKILSGGLYRTMELFDMNLKAGSGSLIGYGEATSPEADKYYVKIEGKFTGGGGSAGQ